MTLAPPSQFVANVITQLERDLGLSRQDLAGAAGVSTRTVERWHNGGQPQSEARKRLDTLVALHQRLAATFTSMEGARAWLHHPNEYLRGLRPVEVLRVGHPEQVSNALEVIDAGIYL